MDFVCFMIKIHNVWLYKGESTTSWVIEGQETYTVPLNLPNSQENKQNEKTVTST